MHYSCRPGKPYAMAFFSVALILLLQPLGSRKIIVTARGRLVQPRYNTGPGIRYVGSKACARCHAAIYHQFRKTAMGRSMTLPDESSKLGIPTSPFTMYDGRYRRYYQIFRKDSTLLQSEYEVGPKGHEIYRDTQAIAYLMGAGENGISYIVRKGGYLFEAPLSYYTALHSWALSPGYQLGDYGFHRRVLVGCAVCHSGRAQPVPSRPGLYGDPAFTELGIGCENCHGPGELHVAERLRGAPLEGTVDRTIVNPANLQGWLADNICMMCHQVGGARVLQPGKAYLDFRPGTPLDRTLAIFAVPFTAQSPPQSPHLQYYTLMTLSRCYSASGGKLSCITCHDPHRRPTGAQAVSFYRSRCLQCHTESSCKLPLAERRRQNPPDNCAGCHMPRQNLKGIAHSALTNHRIIAYPGEPFPRSTFHQTTPSLPDLVHVDAVPGSEMNPISPVTLFQAYGELMNAHPEYRSRYLKMLSEAYADQPDNPHVLSAVARREAAGGTAHGLVSARKLLKQVISRGAASAADYELYGHLLALSGERAAAIRTLKQGIALNPYSTRLYKQLALTYAHFHAYENALAVMKQELRIFPEDSYMRSIIHQIETDRAGH